MFIVQRIILPICKTALVKVEAQGSFIELITRKSPKRILLDPSDIAMISSRVCEDTSFPDLSSNLGVETQRALS